VPVADWRDQRHHIIGRAAELGLGAGDTAEHTAKAAEQTARHTKRLADSAVTGGLTFA